MAGSATAPGDLAGHGFAHPGAGGHAGREQRGLGDADVRKPAASRVAREGEHERLIAGKVADILCGGDVPAGTPVTEQYLLDLEREGFLSLCGEQKTLERIGHLLKTGKPLRN